MKRDSDGNLLYYIYFYEFRIGARTILDIGIQAPTQARADKRARKVLKHLPLKTKMYFDRIMDRGLANEYLA